MDTVPARDKCSEIAIHNWDGYRRRDQTAGGMATQLGVAKLLAQNIKVRGEFYGT
jgi:hypothetical protein